LSWRLYSGDKALQYFAAKHRHFWRKRFSTTCHRSSHDSRSEFWNRDCQRANHSRSRWARLQLAKRLSESGGTKAGLGVAPLVGRGQRIWRKEYTESY